MSATGVATEEATASPNIRSGKVKERFNVRKGMGFIAQKDGPDIFLHITCLQAFGLARVSEGDNITCEVTEGPRGLRCSRIITFAKSIPSPPPNIQCVSPEATDIFGPVQMTVKWFDGPRGFGFFERPNEPDVFIHMAILKQCGIDYLAEDQVALVRYGPNRNNPKRLVAVEVSLDRW